MVLIFFDNLIESQQSTHPSGLAILSQVHTDLVNDPWPLLRKVVLQDLADTHGQLESKIK